MIVNERLTTYLHSLDTDNSVFLENLRTFAEEKEVPIIRREMESFLSVLLALKKPERILEAGTGIAYSALYMAEHSSAVVTTIENYEKRSSLAEKHIREAGMEDRIILLKADVNEVLKTLDGPFDLIFLDAAKAQYIEILPEVLRLLPSGGVLLADNVLQEGLLIESRFSTERRQRTIHERMRRFLWEIKHNESLLTTILTVGDGVSLSIRK